MFRRARLHRQVTSTFLVLFLLPPIAGATETWTLQIEHRYERRCSVVHEAFTNQSSDLQSASGTVNIIVSDKELLSGQGTLSLEGSYIDDLRFEGGFQRESANASGGGTLKVTGEADGKYLYVTLEGRLLATGNLTSVSSTLPNPDFRPYDLSIDGVRLANKLVIERQPGAHVTSRFDSKPKGADHCHLIIVTKFSLSGESVKESSTRQPENEADDEDLWTLTLDSVCTGPGGSSQTIEVSGQARFVPPRQDGPVIGEGPVEVNLGYAAWTGKMTLQGRLEDGELRFIHNYIYEDLRVGDSLTSSGQTTAPYIQSLEDAGDAAGRISLRNGAEFVQEYDVFGTHCRDTYRLFGKEVERWRVDVKGWDTDERGGNTHFGPRIRWEIHVDIRLENGVFKHGVGHTVFAGVESYSVPEGLYVTTAVPVDYITSDLVRHKTPWVNLPVFSVQAIPMGNRKWRLNLATPNQGSFIAVGCESKLSDRADEIVGRLGKSLETNWKELHVIELPLQVDVVLIDGWSAGDASNAMDGQNTKAVRLD